MLIAVVYRLSASKRCQNLSLTLILWTLNFSAVTFILQSVLQSVLHKPTTDSICVSLIKCLCVCVYLCWRFLGPLQTVRMAGRRVALKAIDWLAFAERVPPNQRGMFNALKTRSDAIAAKSVSDHQQAIVLKSSGHWTCTVPLYQYWFGVDAQSS